MDILAVGDFFNLMAVSGVSNLTFQPALPNVFMLGTTGNWGAYTQITNGVDIAYLGGPLNATSPLNMNQVQKVFINNTNYITIEPDTNGQFISGVQVA